MEDDKKDQKKEKQQENSELSNKQEERELDKSEDSMPPEMREEFQHLPPEAQKQVSRMFSMIMSSGPAPHPIFSKMNTEQVGKFIDNIENDFVRDHKNRISVRRWGFATLVVVLLFILALAAGCFWKDKLEYIAPIITALIAGVGGYGFGLSQKERR